MYYIQGEAGNQVSLFPNGFVPDDRLVRVIEGYMARLTLREIDFSKPRPLPCQLSGACAEMLLAV